MKINKQTDTDLKTTTNKVTNKTNQKLTATT